MELQKLIDGLKNHRNGAASYESVDEAIRVFESMRDMDGEKVCKGLECCDAPNDHEHCPYDGERHYNICTDKLLKDALALIRQQQERIAELEAVKPKKGYWTHPTSLDCCCSVCGNQPESEPGESVPLYNYCPYCGAEMAVKWDE